MKTIKVVYKCRMCGKNFTSNQIKSLYDTRDIIRKLCEKKELEINYNKIYRYSIHECNENISGFADFIGCVECED